MRHEIKEKRFARGDVQGHVCGLGMYVACTSGLPGRRCEGQCYCDLNGAINISGWWPVGGDVNDL